MPAFARLPFAAARIIPAAPRLMQQDCQLSRNRYEGPFYGVLPATAHQLQAPATTMAVLAETPQNGVRPLHQQFAQIGIALFADPKLWPALA